MVIAPGTMIHLIEGCPLDDDYEHTIYWTEDERLAQQAYFIDNVPDENGFTDTRVFHHIYNNTYQRVERGKMRVEVPVGTGDQVKSAADVLAKCNYVAFINASYHGKWYYGFIQSVEYVNNKVAEITFTIDVLQTWYFDYDLMPCFVDREHVYRDGRGENTVEEGLEFGDYFFHEKNLIALGKFKEHDNTQLEYYIVVAATVGCAQNTDYKDIQPTDIIDVYGGSYGGVYSGCAFNIFRYPETANQFLDAVTQANKIDSVVGAFMVPTNFFRGDLPIPQPVDYNRLDPDWQPLADTGYDGGDNDSYGSGGVSSAIIPRFTTARTTNVYGKPDVIEGEPGVHPLDYTPRNKKLLSYPYSKVVLTNLNGEYAEYRYEYFSGNTFSFGNACALSVEPEAGCWPKNYKGLTDNYVEKIVIKDFPQCSFSIDSFKAWLAQRKFELAAGFGSDLVHGAGGAAMLAATGGTAAAILPGYTVATMGAKAAGGIKGGSMVGGSVESALMKAAQIADKSTLPRHAMGNTTNVFNMALGIQGFHVYNAQIRPYWAEKLDGFFDRYGYKVGRFKEVSRKNRKWYTYIKTINCEITGSLPTEYYKEIISIYNRGITFWTSPLMVGKYFETVTVAGVTKTVVADNTPDGGGWS